MDTEDHLLREEFQIAETAMALAGYPVNWEISTKPDTLKHLKGDPSKGADLF